MRRIRQRIVQSTARIARTVVNVAICRIFWRSILRSVSTADDWLPTAYRPRGNLLFSRSFSWVMVAAVGAVGVLRTFLKGSLIARCSLGSQPDNENAYILPKASLMKRPRGLHKSVCKLPRTPLPRPSVHKVSPRESMKGARPPHSRGQDLPTHAPSRGAYTKCGACPAAHPHRDRSAKPAGNTGMVSGPGSRTNRGQANPQQARQGAEDGGRKERS